MRKWIAGLMVILGVALTVPAARAATWDGNSGTDDNWSTAGNWSDDADPAGKDILFANTGATNVIGAVNNIVDANRTVGRLQYQNTGSSYHTTEIPAGRTLTANNTSGDYVFAGNMAVNDNSRMNIQGGGTLELNHPGRGIYFHGGDDWGYKSVTLDMSKLDTFNATIQNLYLGYTASRWAMVYLATNNTITAAGELGVGGHYGDAQGGANLFLGTSNVLNVGTLYVGRGRSRATMSMQGDGSGASVRIRGAAGGTNRVATVDIGPSGVGFSASTGTMDFEQAAVDAMFGSVIVGRGIGVTNLRGYGYLYINRGVINATTIRLGENTASGQLNIGANAEVIVETLRMDQDGSVNTGRVNLVGGTLTAKTVQKGTATSGAREINWTGGTIQNYPDANTTISDLTSFNVAGSSAACMFEVDATRAITVNSAMTGTGGFTKTGAGMLALNANALLGGSVVLESGMLTNAVGVRLGADSLSVSNGVSVVANVATVSAGIEIGGDFTLDGQMRINFTAPTPLVIYGLKWTGNHVDTLTNLVAQGKLVPDYTGLGDYAGMGGVYYHPDGYTYIGTLEAFDEVRLSDIATGTNAYTTSKNIRVEADVNVPSGYTFSGVAIIHDLANPTRDPESGEWATPSASASHTNANFALDANLPDEANADVWVHVKFTGGGPDLVFKRMASIYYNSDLTKTRQNLTWDGGGSPDKQWSVPANWNLDLAPYHVSTGTLTFANTGATNVIGAVNNIVDANRTVGRLQYQNTGSSYHTTEIPAGRTLTANNTSGDYVFAGNMAVDNNSTMNIQGGGTLELNHPGRGIYFHGGDDWGGKSVTLDMSKLDTFNATIQNLYLGYSASRRATVYLATNNTITAAGELGVGGHYGDAQGGANLFLGTSNVLNVGTLYVGRGRSTATMSMQGDGSGASVRIRGAAGGTNRVATVDIGPSGFGYSASTGTMDFEQAAVDAMFGSVIVGRGIGATNQRGYGYLHINRGVIDATMIRLGENTASGQLNIGTNAEVIVETIRMDHDGSVNTGRVNLVGGTLTAKTVQKGTATSGAREINWTGGTIQNYPDANTTISDLTSFNVAGSPAACAFNVAADRTLTVNSAMTGTGGFTKSGEGQLTLTAAGNSLSNVTVTAGHLQVDGALTLTIGGMPGGLDVAAGAAFGIGASGLIHLNFTAPREAPKSDFCGLRWRGGSVAVLKDLANAGRLTWDSAGLGGEDIGIFAVGGDALIGVPTTGTLILIR